MLQCLAICLLVYLPDKRLCAISCGDDERNDIESHQQLTMMQINIKYNDTLNTVLQVCWKMLSAYYKRPLPCPYHVQSQSPHC